MSPDDPERHWSHWDDPRVGRIAAYLEQHFRERLTAEQIARAVGVSRSTLYRLCREGAGITLADWCQRLRLADATRLLTTTKLNVDEVAFRSGVGSQRTLQRWFRQILGITPTAYARAKPPPVHVLLPGRGRLTLQGELLSPPGQRLQHWEQPGRPQQARAAGAAARASWSGR